MIKSKSIKKHQPVIQKDIYFIQICFHGNILSAHFLMTVDICMRQVKILIKLYKPLSLSDQIHCVHVNMVIVNINGLKKKLCAAAR